MREASYPDLVNHGEQHQELLRAPDVSQYLERWFVPHLTHDDKKLADFLASRTTVEIGETAPDRL